MTAGCFLSWVFSRDKDYPYIIRKLCPYAEQIIAIETPDNPRALPAEELAEAICPCNPHVHAEKNIAKAVEELFEMAGKDDVILSFGSLSFIGDITRIVNTRKRYPDHRYRKGITNDRFTGMPQGDRCHRQRDLTVI